MRLILAMFLVLLLSACNAVSDMKDMFDKQELVQNALKDEYGFNSQVGWNIQNGVLTQVTIIFDANEVREMKVSELESMSKEAVATSFKSTPRVINVQVACNSTN